ncbi:MAG: hypothetical protein M3Y59_11185 [Myxococcota bacterium]|nr:hypothetical protein [Myxococcota bacterium]
MFAAALLAPVAMAEERGFVVGRLALFDRGSPLSISAAEEEVGGESISLELRKDALTYEATLLDDGSFLVEGPPGDYRLEYIRVGDRAEFILPQQLRVEKDAVTCAGTIAVKTGPIENLGANQTNTTEVSDSCKGLMPKLTRFANGRGTARTELARPGPLIQHLEEVGWMERVGGIRLELGGLGVSALRLGYQHDFPLVPGWHLAAQLYVSAGQLLNYLPQFGEATGKELLGGGGLSLLGLDVVGYGGARLYSVPVGPQPVVGALGRFNLGAFGLGMRAELLPYQDWTVFVDVSPLALVGLIL